MKLVTVSVVLRSAQAIHFVFVYQQMRRYMLNMSHYVISFLFIFVSRSNLECSIILSVVAAQQDAENMRRF